MARNEPLRALRIIRKENPFGRKAIRQLRLESAEFFLRYGSPMDLSVKEVTAGGVPGFWIKASASSENKTILFFHAGGFTIGSTRDHMSLCGKLSESAKTTVMSIDYRLAPEHPFPAAAEDSFSAYCWLLEQGVDPNRIIPVGISAGGTLVLTTLLQARDRDLPLPPCAVCMSPAVDLTFPGKSVETNKRNDWIDRTGLDGLRFAYLRGHDPSDPMASPIYGDLKGLPPILLQAGTHEILLDDLKAFYEKAKGEGVDVTFQLWEYMFHGWQLFPSLVPGAAKAIESAGEYINKTLGESI